MTWTMTAVPSTELKSIWPKVASLLSPAIGFSGGRIDMASVFDWLTDQRYILWLAYQDGRIGAAFVTREAHYPLRSMLAVDLAGGSHLDEWANSATATFQAYARAAGLSGVECAGRKGWTRAVRDCGWTETGVLCEIGVADKKKKKNG